MELFAPFIVLVASIVIARAVNERSYRHLSQDEKAGLFDLFSKYRVYGYVILVILILMIFALPRLHLLSFSITLYLCGALFILYFIVIAVITSRILHDNHYPLKYISLYIASNVIRMGGVAVFIIFFVYYYGKMF